MADEQTSAFVRAHVPVIRVISADVERSSVGEYNRASFAEWCAREFCGAEPEPVSHLSANETGRVIGGAVLPHTIPMYEARHRANDHRNKSLAAIDQVRRHLDECQPDVILLASTHWMPRDGFFIDDGAQHEDGCDASYQGVEPQLFSFPGDPELAALIGDLARSAGLPVRRIHRVAQEHAVWVPGHLLCSGAANTAFALLYLVARAARSASTVWRDHRRGGAATRSQSIFRRQRRIVAHVRFFQAAGIRRAAGRTLRSARQRMARERPAWQAARHERRRFRNLEPGRARRTSLYDAWRFRQRCQRSIAVLSGEQRDGISDDALSSLINVPIVPVVSTVRLGHGSNTQRLRLPAFCLQLRRDFFRDREVEKPIQRRRIFNASTFEHRVQRFSLRRLGHGSIRC